jgi:uncharacterized membrane protein
MVEFFASYASVIVFLHVLSAVVWVGGMILMRFALHQALPLVTTPKERLGLSLLVMKRFFNIVIFAVLLLLITAISMSIGFNFSGSSLGFLVHIKEAIWTIMTLNFAFIYYKREKAQKIFNSGDMALVKNELQPIANILIPVNIGLGVLALFLGVTLRGL